MYNTRGSRLVHSVDLEQLDEGTDSVYTIYDYGEIFANLDREQWENRKQFFLTTLTFCLNLGNIVRFPKEVILGENGHYIYIYILTTVIFGNVMLAFEVCLGQCSVQRFLRIFWQCPFLEGLPYSMAIYCTLLSVYYSVLNVYSYLYIFPALTFSHLDYSKCITRDFNCSTDSIYLGNSPEYLYHMKRVVFFESKSDDQFMMNWRNTGVLMFVWACMCVVIMKGIRRIKWPFLLGGPILCTVLLLTFCLTFACKGAWYGISQLFNFTKQDKFTMTHWIDIFEQIIVSYGMGLGPLIIHGCCSKFQSPAHIDCFFMIIITLIASLLSVGIVYSGIGIKALHYNTSAEVILKSLREHPNELQGHILFTQLFTRMPFILSQICSFIFFAALFLTGFLSLIWLTEVIVLALYQVTRIADKYRLYINVGVCVLCVLLGIILTKRGGHSIMYIMDRYFVGVCLTPMVIMELVAIVYCYGAFRFSDDIYFMLGFQPGIFYVCLWIILPIILTVNYGYFVFCEIFHPQMDSYTVIIVISLTILIFLPVMIFAICNTIIFTRRGKLLKVFMTPEIFPEDSLMTIGEIYSSVTPSKRKVVFSADDIEDNPGPSRKLRENTIGFRANVDKDSTESDEK